MGNKLFILMVNTDPSDAPELGAPFVQASVARAMDYEVEVVLAARAGELAFKGVADKLFVNEGSSKSVYDFIKDAHDAGVTFKVCTPALAPWERDLIPEIEATVGGGYIIEQAMRDGVVTFTY